MNLASNNRDDTWFDSPGSVGLSLIPDQTFATPHPQAKPDPRVPSQVDTLLSTPWFGRTPSDAAEWRAVAEERRVQRAASALQPQPQPLSQSQRPAEVPARSVGRVGPLVPLWVMALTGSALLLTGALAMSGLLVLASVTLLVLG